MQKQRTNMGEILPRLKTRESFANCLENIDKRLIHRDLEAIREDTIAEFRADLQAEYDTIKSEVRKELKIESGG